MINQKEFYVFARKSGTTEFQPVDFGVSAEIVNERTVRKELSDLGMSRDVALQAREELRREGYIVEIFDYDPSVGPLNLTKMVLERGE
jgi:predicted GNAT family acetyltransferase